MTPAAFHHRVDELLLDGLLTVDEAIAQAAWEMDHGRTEIDVPVVTGRAS